MRSKADMSRLNLPHGMCGIPHSTAWSEYAGGCRPRPTALAKLLRTLVVFVHGRSCRITTTTNAIAVTDSVVNDTDSYY